eukprot:gnl/TRDRNA2_/TRDRNA2_174035_c4_seq12.p1 gnl/TRDRNA2_/TRDRNA2_174035_c4~~gnl/TRDRNA2_/TRDRNA2_174035_c4_seq12.p1  ORF type:complete len:277 (-),score=17.12 gnl/TRDRNA2_/TRDRNA2_174035_c4_seq12:56-793(-)
MEQLVERRPEIAKGLAGSSVFTKHAGHCLICSDSGVTLLKLQTCNHDAQICEDCMRNYIAERLEDIHSFPVKCPFHTNGCDTIVGHEIVASFFGEQDISWQKFIRFHLLQTIGYLVACPWCDAILVTESEADIHGQETQCASCNRSVCIDCGCVWHFGLTCAQYKGKEIDSRTQALLNECKRCPGCGEGILHYRNDGCHTMTCKRCNKQFCYVCGAPYPCRCPFSGHTCCGVRGGRDCGCLPRPG